MRILRSINRYVFYLDEVNESYSIDEYVNEKGVHYFSLSSSKHYLDITGERLLGHTLHEALKCLIDKTVQHLMMIKDSRYKIESVKKCLDKLEEYSESIKRSPT